MTNEQDYGGDLCKNHSARSEKEFCRVCPSNLNKKELENVYFTLLENNLDLKTTINSQREKIKILSTKVQRLTALQKTYLGKEPKECCGSKAIIHEQKECISELRRANQCLSERVRQLNMRLCSAKQFLKRSPFQSTSRCNRCSNKNQSMSALITKRSETNLRSTTASGQYLVKDIMSSRTADNNIISQEKGVQYDFCDENKCRDRIEELQKKNDDLEEELAQTLERHSAATAQLESTVSELRVDSALAGERAARLQQRLGEVSASLAAAETRCDELSVSLSSEQRLVAELQTRLAAAAVSGRIASAIHTHLANAKAKDHTNILQEIEAGVHEKSSTNDNSKFLAVQGSPCKPKAAVRTKFLRSPQLDEFKSPDDSGYTEINRSQDVDEAKASTYINQVLLEKIADLQNQINNLKAFKNNYNKPSNGLKLPQEMNIESTEAFTSLVDEKHQIDENVMSESSESVVTEKKANSNIVTIQEGLNDQHDGVPSKAKPVDPVSQHKGNYNSVEPQNDPNPNKFGDNFKHFKRQSKDFSGDNNTPPDKRKLSLQGSKSYLEKNNFIKTGSLDENSISYVSSAKGDRETRQKVDNLSAKNSNQMQITTSNNDAAGFNISDKSILHNLNEEVKEIDKESQNKAVIENPGKNIENYTKDDKKKESDSSNGTYTIKKDENVLKLKSESNGTYTIKKDENESKLKSDSNNVLLNVTEGNKTYKSSYTLADIKAVLNKASSKDKVMSRRRSVTSEPKTYTKARDVSPESTECEISSLSDLPSERDGRTSSRSPGEERPPTTSSLSTSAPTATSAPTDPSLSDGELPCVPDGRTSSRSPGEERPPTTSSLSTSAPTATTAPTDRSLSDGELPCVPDVTILSDGEKRLSHRTGKSHSVPEMQHTLAAVRRELARCGTLLRARAARSLDSPGAI